MTTTNYADVKSFEFEFENEESLIIDSEHVESFALIDISWNAEKKYGKQAVEMYPTISRFHFMIDKDADLPLNDGTTRTVAQRMSCEDVTRISITYKNGRVEDFYIPWDDDDEDFDKWQIFEEFDDMFVIRR